MRIDIHVTGTTTERADVIARANQFCAENPDARVIAQVVEPVCDRLPEIGLAGQQQCQQCGVWHNAGQSHQCLTHGGA